MFQTLLRSFIRLLAFVAAGCAGSALAGTLAIGGNLQPPSPQMPVVFISPPLCTGQGVTPVTYRAYSIYVSLTGSYTFDLTDPLNHASFYLYENAFNPASGMTNCVQADNSTPRQMVYTLQARRPYYLVVFDDSFAQDTGVFTAAVNGPGDIAHSLAVPTLTEWSVVLLSLLLAAAALVRLRRR